jgi:hypothetical protein
MCPGSGHTFCPPPVLESLQEPRACCPPAITNSEKFGFLDPHPTHPTLFFGTSDHGDDTNYRTEQQYRQTETERYRARYALFFFIYIRRFLFIVLISIFL